MSLDLDKGRDEVAPEELTAVPVRHWGRWIGAGLVIALLAMVVWAFANAKINWNVVGDYLTYDRIMEGALNTLWITVCAMVLGLVLGMLLAVMRLSDNPVLSSVSLRLHLVLPGHAGAGAAGALVQPLLHLRHRESRLLQERDEDVMTPFLAALLGLG